MTDNALKTENPPLVRVRLNRLFGCFSFHFLDLVGLPHLVSCGHTIRWVQ